MFLKRNLLKNVCYCQIPEFLGLRSFSDDTYDEKPIPRNSVRLRKTKGNFFNADYFGAVQTPFDLRVSTVKKWVERKTYEINVANQKISFKKQNVLGKELYAAHFFVRLGGSIKLMGEKNWISLEKITKKEKKNSQEEEEEDDDDERTSTLVLPSQYTPGLFLEGVNLCGKTLFYEGLEHLENLQHFKYINLSNSEMVDDWFLDFFAGNFSNTLEYLDVSNCNKISTRGLVCFYKFKKLKMVNVRGICDSNEFKHHCALLEETCPNLIFDGVTYTLDHEKESKNS